MKNSVPKFPRSRLGYKVPRMVHGEYAVGTWTKFHCSFSAVRVSGHEAVQKFMELSRITTPDRVVGIINHKKKTIWRAQGTLIEEVPARARLIA